MYTPNYAFTMGGVESVYHSFTNIGANKSVRFDPRFLAGLFQFFGRVHDRFCREYECPIKVAHQIENFSQGGRWLPPMHSQAILGFDVFEDMHGILWRTVNG